MRRPTSIPVGLLPWLLSWFLAGACTRTAPAQPPVALQVEVSGCAAVSPARGCEPEASGKVRLFIETTPGARVVTSADGRQLGEGAVHLQDGTALLRLSLPPGASQLAVRAEKQGLVTAGWTLALAVPQRHALLDKAVELHGAGKREEALAVLSAGFAALAPELRGAAEGLLGRMELERGNVEAARAALCRAVTLHVQAGQTSRAADDALALVYLLSEVKEELGEARRVLERAAAFAGTYPDGRVRIAYYRGLVAVRGGDFRAALESFEQAREGAERLGLRTVANNARMELAELFQGLGRTEAAEAQLDAATRALPEGTQGCARGDTNTNLGWLALLQAEARPGSRPSPRPTLERALADYHATCPDPLREANAHGNLALAALHARDVRAAREHLAQARGKVPLPAPSLGAWWLDVEARIALLERQPTRALSVYERLEGLASASGDGEGRWRAALGRGRALEAQGAHDAAAAAYAQAEQLLDRHQLAVPLGGGRSSYLAMREQGATDRVHLLLARGSVHEAFVAARRSRARLLATLHRVDRVAQLSGEARERWESALKRYRRERSELEAEAAEDWKLSSARLQRVMASRRARQVRLLAALDSAYAVLAEGGVTEEQLEALPSAGTLLLGLHPLRDGWVGFAADATGVVARRLAAPRDATGEVLAQQLLATFDTALAAARRIQVLPYGPLRAVDLHALPFRGAPLLAHAPVEYRLDVPRATSREGLPAEARADTPVLVVADPRGDLPSAADEGARVRKALGAARPVTLLLGAEATRGRVLELLQQASLLHYAGHGTFDGPDAAGSALPLADGALSLGDILALPGAPAHVVLSGCETARTAEQAPEGLGLAQAFLLSGSRAVVAATRPVTDALARDVSLALHGSSPGRDAAGALRQALLSLRERGTQEDWAAFRVLVP